MKLKNLFLGLLATAAVFASCQPNEEQLGAPALNLDPETMEFDVKAGEQELSLLATRDWAVANENDWIQIDPASGSGSNDAQKLTVTVLANPESDRTAELEFSIGMITKTLTVNQKGEKGVAELEITSCWDFVKAADKNTESILKGVVENLSIRDSYKGFDLYDGTAIVSCAFPANLEEKLDEIKNGKIVTVKGKYAFYESKKLHQVDKAEILKIEDGSIPEVEIKKLTIKEFIDKAETYMKYELTGTIVGRVSDGGFKGFDIDDGTATVTCAFPSNFDEYKDNLKTGQKVTIQGPYQFFKDKQSHQVNNGFIVKVEGGGNVTPPGDAEKISVKDFIDKADSSKEYELEGTVSNFKSDYCSFNLTDATGTIVVWSVDNKDQWSSKIENGGMVRLRGSYQYYNNSKDPSKSKPEVVHATILAFTPAGGEVNPEPDPEIPGEIKKVSVKEFLDAPVSDSQWYELTATIDDISSEEYGNLYVKDKTGTLYIYGLTQTKVDKNDKSFSKLGLKVTDVLTFAAKRGAYNGSDQAVGAYYISHVKGEGIDEKPDGPAKEPFTSQVSWTVSKDSKNDPNPSYSEDAKINGASENTPVLKLGAGSKYGKATLTIPAGTKKLGFYACAWKGTSVAVKFSNGVEVSGIRANEGATSNGPFTLDNVTALDYFVIEMNGETELTVETFGKGKRAIIFGINPVK